MGNLIRIGSEFLVNSTAAGNQTNPAIAALAGGGFVATWVDDTAGVSHPTVRAQIFDSSGARSGGEFTVVSAVNLGDTCAVSGLSGGGFVVAWNNGGDVETQVLNAVGQKVGTVLNIGSPDNGQRNPVVTGLDGDQYALSWVENERTSRYLPIVKSQVYDLSGTKIGKEADIGSLSDNPHISRMASGGFAIDFADVVQGTPPERSSNALSLFSASGRQIGSTIQPDITLSANTGSGPIAGLAGGGFVTGWNDGTSSNSQMKLQLFDAGGGAIGPSFEINALPAQSKTLTAIGALHSGGFVAVWTDYAATSGDTSFSSIHAQVYDAAGQTLGSEFVVNTETLDDQEVPTITVLANDDFVISWQDNNETAGDNDPSSIKAQIFSPPSPPVITSNGGEASAAITLAENLTAVTTIVAADADKAATLTYRISGGDDAALFAIDAKSGALSFIKAANFEKPTDAGLDNVYNVSVQASDGLFIDSQTLAITITNINEAPRITSGKGGSAAVHKIAENTLGVAKITAVDPEPGTTLTYSISGGTDAARFVINAATGSLAFRTAPDFEAPADTGGNNIYDVVVRVSDGVSSDTQNLAIKVSNIVNEVLRGTAAADTLIGAGGNDTLIGGLNADTMRGGAGNDTYVVDNAGDKVIEAPDGGTDTVRSSVSLTLSQNVENLVLTGSATLSGTGNALANTITGNDGDNLLSGLGGADRLLGGDGADTLDGGGGRDVLTGGGGRDVLTGGADADTFVFSTAPVSGESDRILDFSEADGDRLAFSAKAFTALGPVGTLGEDAFYAASGAFRAHDASDRLIYDTASGKLFYDEDGLGGRAPVLIAILGTTLHPDLVADDIAILV